MESDFVIFTIAASFRTLDSNHTCRFPAHRPTQDSTETNDSLLTCFNQWFWMVELVKLGKKQQQQSHERCYKFVRMPAGWNYWSLMIFTALLDCSWCCNTRGHNESRRQRDIRGTRKQRKSHFRIRFTGSYALRNVRLDPFKGCAFLHDDSICLTGQVVLNISQFSQRTVELLRTT